MVHDEVGTLVYLNTYLSKVLKNLLQQYFFNKNKNFAETLLNIC